MSMRSAMCIAVLVSCLGIPFDLRAQTTPSAPAAAEPVPRLFAVEIKTGAAWDSAKPAHEQKWFREHSSNLKQLRDQGVLILGARYSDKGLVVLQASTPEEAHAMMQRDAAMQGHIFTYELHEMSIFYGGSVQPKKRAP